MVRIFPNAESCLRLVRALAVETHENWLEGTRYLNMQHLAEHKKEATGRLGNIDLYGLILGKQSRQKAIRKWG